LKEKLGLGLAFIDDVTGFIDNATALVYDVTAFIDDGSGVGVFCCGEFQHGRSVV
jgi:hypothetical protein